MQPRMSLRSSAASPIHSAPLATPLASQRRLGRRGRKDARGVHFPRPLRATRPNAPTGEDFPKPAPQRLRRQSPHHVDGAREVRTMRPRQEHCRSVFVCRPVFPAGGAHCDVPRPRRGRSRDGESVTASAAMTSFKLSECRPSSTRAWATREPDRGLM